MRYVSKERKILERIRERLRDEIDESEIKYLIEVREIIERKMCKKKGGDAI